MAYCLLGEYALRANNATIKQFEEAITKHINSPSNKIIGTYRGQPVTHYLDPATGLNVIRNAKGEFLSGWKLNPDQLKNVIERGKL